MTKQNNQKFFSYLSRGDSKQTQIQRKLNLIKKNAFTILETAILIFILTIIIFGIFFAKKMIQESSVKSLIMQIQKYENSLNNFSQKYHGLPGDIQNTLTYGITPTNTDGNGDNIITDRIQKYLLANGEITNFWLHLSKSQMLDESYDGKKDEEAKTSSTFPMSKIGEKVGIIVFGNEGKTFFQIGFDFASPDKIYTKNRSLKTDEAFLFDKKIDDGNPKKGRVLAAGSEGLNILENNECIKLGEYDQSNVSPSCQMLIEVR